MYSSFGRATNYRSNKINGMSPLDRKVKRNPKYNSVRSTVDTGASMSKVDIITTRAYLNRRAELVRAAPVVLSSFRPFVLSPFLPFSLSPFLPFAPALCSLSCAPSMPLRAPDDADVPLMLTCILPLYTHFVPTTAARVAQPSFRR